MRSSYDAVASASDHRRRPSCGNCRRRRVPQPLAGVARHNARGSRAPWRHVAPVEYEQAQHCHQPRATTCTSGINLAQVNSTGGV